MPTDYGYINARLKGQHSKLLIPGAYEELLNLPDFNAFTKWLASSNYSKEWQEAQSRYSGLSAAEEALSANFNAAIKMMSIISEGQPNRLISIILRRWDLANIKAVVRGIHNRWDAEEIIRAVLPAGNFNQVKLKELCLKEDLGELADTLATWNDDFFVPLNKALPEYRQEHDLYNLELTLDKFYYYQALKKLAGMGANKCFLRDMLRLEIDLLNTKSISRLREQNQPDLDQASRYYLPGGKLLSMDKYMALLNPRESKRIIATLKGTFIYRMLSRNGGVRSLEDVLEKRYWQQNASAYRGDPLGIEVAVGYLWQKYFEVVNLRLIARGKYFGLSADDIKNQFLLA